MLFETHKSQNTLLIYIFMGITKPSRDSIYIHYIRYCTQHSEHSAVKLSLQKICQHYGSSGEYIKL